jgi:hypothetical protein
MVKTVLDQPVTHWWKNQSPLKLWREFAGSEKKRRKITLEQHQGREKKLCSQGV